MPVNSVAENAFGYLGAICWTVQLIPQIWKSWRTKSTEGLSHWLVLLWGLSGPFLGVYVIVQNLNIPLILQPQLFTAFSLISWTQCQYYTHKRSVWTCVAMYCALIGTLAGFQAGMVFAVKSVYHDGVGNARALQFFGVFSSVLISLALLPQYYEIWKHGEVIGISILFMFVDLMGGIFSDLSLVFKADLDVIAAVTYSIVVVMDAAVIICALILNPRANKRRRRATADISTAESASGPVSYTSTPVEVNETSKSMA